MYLHLNNVHKPEEYVLNLHQHHPEVYPDIFLHLTEKKHVHLLHIINTKIKTSGFYLLAVCIGKNTLQSWHNIDPQRRQWCWRRVRWNDFAQLGHLVTEVPSSQGTTFCSCTHKQNIQQSKLKDYLIHTILCIYKT